MDKVRLLLLNPLRVQGEKDKQLNADIQGIW